MHDKIVKTKITFLGTRVITFGASKRFEFFMDRIDVHFQYRDVRESFFASRAIVVNYSPMLPTGRIRLER